MLFSFQAGDTVPSLVVTFILIASIPSFFVSAYYCYVKIIERSTNQHLMVGDASEKIRIGKAPGLWDIWAARRGGLDNLADLLVSDGYLFWAIIELLSSPCLRTASSRMKTCSSGAPFPC